jgi:hypothetical protein
LAGILLRVILGNGAKKQSVEIQKAKMKKIEKQFTQKGFDFKQSYREGNYAIYERWNESYPERKHYEVVKIQSHNGYAIGGQSYPPSEFYPSSNSWGVHGFTCSTKENAYKRLEKMAEEEKNRETDKKQKKQA